MLYQERIISLKFIVKFYIALKIVRCLVAVVIQTQLARLSADGSWG